MLLGDLRKGSWIPSGVPLQACTSTPTPTRNYLSLAVLQPTSEQRGLYWVVAWSPSKAFCSSPWGPAPAEATPESPWRGIPAAQLLDMKQEVPLGILGRALPTQKEGSLLRTTTAKKLNAKLFTGTTFKYLWTARPLQPCAAAQLPASPAEQLEAEP